MLLIAVLFIQITISEEPLCEEQNIPVLQKKDEFGFYVANTNELSFHTQYGYCYGSVISIDTKNPGDQWRDRSCAQEWLIPFGTDVIKVKSGKCILFYILLPIKII